MRKASGGQGRHCLEKQLPTSIRNQALPQASSLRHEPQWTGPGEQLWLSVPPKYSPHGWQVLGERRAPHFPRWLQDLVQPAQEEQTPERLQGYRGGGAGRTGGRGRGEVRGGVRLNWGSGLGQLPDSSDTGAEPDGAGLDEG